MTNNPLRMSAAPRATREPIDGDTVTIRRVNKDGQEISEPLMFRRTGRPYAQDLCQAYNDARPYEARSQVEWFVDVAGSIRPGILFERTGWSKWKPDPGETDATNAVVARAVAAGISAKEWTRLVNTGGISKEVARTMRERAHAGSE